MSGSASEIHDDALFEILKECKTLPNFLDTVFGFMQRRTDFYHIADCPNSPVGLPDGLAEKLVRHTFFKWKPSFSQKEHVPAASEEVVLSNEETQDLAEASSSNRSFGNPSSNTEPRETPINASNTCNEFAPSESYNGSIFDTYCWSQSISDIDVSVKLPENTRSKDIMVTILPSKISVKVKEKVLLEGDLSQKCRSTSAIWSIENRKLQIHIDKTKEIWWDRLFTTENKLDLSAIDNSRPFEDLSEEAQSKIEELGWNQHRKMLGLPTTDDLSNQELLKAAWNVQGSPFSGPFDPNAVNFM